MGIDYGLERTGLALTNPEATFAWPLCVLELAKFGKRSILLDELAHLALEKKCKSLVMGLPLHLDGTENDMCKIVRNAAQKIIRRTGLPVNFMPETLSSEEARNNLRLSGCTGKALKEALDQEAARIILQSYLEMRGNGP